MRRNIQWRKMHCPKCGWRGERYCNVKLCPECRARLPAESRKPATVCPTCYRPYTPAPVRICGKCGKQIVRFHKWRIEGGSTIVHRDCDNPESYPQEVAS